MPTQASNPGDSMASMSISEQQARISYIIAQTRMNSDLSRQCLEECGWDTNLALQAFQHVTKGGLLPEGALL